MAGERRSIPGELRSRWIAPAALALILAAVYAPLFAGRVLYQRDLSLWLLPARSFVREAVAAGQAPFWNPYVGLGLATLGNPLYGLFYPGNALQHLGSLPVVASGVLWMHLVLGAAGVLWLLRRLGVADLPALLGALAWGLSGFLTSMWTFGILLLAFAWTPLCALGFLGVCAPRGDSPDRRRAARLRAIGWAAAPVALALLTGELFLATVSAGFGLVVAVAARMTAAPPTGDLPGTRSVVIGVAASVALAVCFAAVAVLPAIAMAPSTERRQPLAAAVAEQGSLHPWRVLELGAARMTDRAFAADAGAVRSSVGGGLQPLAVSLYAGGAVLALASLALGRSRRLAAALAALTLVSLLVAMGRYTPAHELFRQLVRPLAYMRYPEKYLAVSFGSLALLAGLGAQRLLSAPTAPPGTAMPWKRLAAVVLLLALIALSAQWLLPRELGAHARAGALQAAIAAAAVLAAAFLARRRTREAGWLLVAVVAVDLAAAAVPVLRWIDPGHLTHPPQVASYLQQRRQPGSPFPPRVYRSPRVQESVARQRPADRAPGEAPSSVETLRENTGALFGIAVLPGYDAGLSPALTRLLAVGRDEILRLVGAEYALLPVQVGAADQRPHLDPLLDPRPGARLYRVRHPLPRVYLAGGARVLGDDEALATGAVVHPAVIDGAVAVVAPPAGAAAVLPSGTDRAGTCVPTSFSPTTLEATCDASAPALAVFVEQYDPAWRATVDGAPAPLLRANLVMRAVPLPAGRHHVILTYHPPGLRAGAAISIIAAFAWLALVLAPRLTRRRD